MYTEETSIYKKAFMISLITIKKQHFNQIHLDDVTLTLYSSDLIHLKCFYDLYSRYIIKTYTAQFYFSVT